MGVKISAKLEPQDVPLGVTHEDVFGRGGYVVVTTGLSGSPTELAINQAINPTVSIDRRKVGMLVFDTSLNKNFRCVNAVNGSWIEVFANNGAVDLSNYYTISQVDNLLQDVGGIPNEAG